VSVGTEHHRAGTVPPQRGGLAIIIVGQSREDLGADQQDAVGATGLDLCRRER
jgi:hypothetical protein